MSRSLNLLLALATFAFGCALALNYPLGQFAPITAFFLYALLVFYKPDIFLIIIPAIIPLIGLAPWSGWISFEELDFLVLATAAGGYGKYSFGGARCTTQRTSLLLFILAVLMSVSISISMARGFADAGGFAFGWFQGYNGPMNSIRIGKSFFLALLLVPLMVRLQNAPENNANRNLSLGIAIGLGNASLAALWERLAFTDLLNFSSDYRSTALFWEMHVGGAALDGWLLLTMPFSIWALRTARTNLQTAIALALIGIASYACLTTFSRGVYLALIVTLPLLAWLLYRREKTVGGNPGTPTWGPKQWIISPILIGVMAVLIFPGSGYRGLLVFLGLLAVSISMPLAIRAIPLSQTILSSLLGGCIGMGLVVMANLIPKGPYFLYGILFVLALAALHWPGIQGNKIRASICVVTFCGLALAAVDVADYWGGADAAPGMIEALIIMIGVLSWGALSAKPLWPTDLRWQGTILTVSVAVSAIVAVFSGGAYMGERFSTSGKDAGGRLAHWQDAISMLRSPMDLAFGKGLGRFPANYYFIVPNIAVPGTYAIENENGNNFLSLTGGGHPVSFGDLMRVSQRLNLSAQGPFELNLKVRAKSDVTIHAEVCEKHLLYVAQCAIRNAKIKVAKSEWQHIKIRLDGPVLNGGVWYAPRIKMFSIGVESQGGAADVDDLALTETGSHNLLANPDFSKEMQNWFFSSDRDHMPWHAKNLQINTLFDQGILGLAASTLLWLVALWRLNIGRGSQHELAPYMTASIIGFLVVGLFDSLTDVPRLAFVYYLVLLYSIALKPGAGSRHKKPGG